MLNTLITVGEVAALGCHIFIDFKMERKNWSMGPSVKLVLPCIAKRTNKCKKKFRKISKSGRGTMEVL